MSQEHRVITEHLHPKSIFLQNSARDGVSEGEPLHTGKSVICLYDNWAFRTDKGVSYMILARELCRVPGKSPIRHCQETGLPQK